MYDLSAVTDLEVPGCWIISADQMREQIRWAQRIGHANCYFQRFFSVGESGEEDTVICVVDLYDERWPTKSVTNDAEYVVRLAVSSQGDYPIVYRDTEGRWDELRHNGVHFTCFRSLDTTDHREAMMRALAFRESDSQAYGAN
jgi:hypothetical protein